MIPTRALSMGLYRGFLWLALRARIPVVLTSLGDHRLVGDGLRSG